MNQRLKKPTAEDRPSPVKPVARISSRDLLGEATEIGIEHRGDIYRLRCTRNGKLILNK